MADSLKQKSDRAIAGAAHSVRETVKRIDVPGANEIKDLNRQANRDKEASSGGREIPIMDARQGVTLGTMRYVWAISLVLAVAAMVLVFIAS